MEKENKILELAKKRFKIALEAESENREKELDDIKFLAASPDDNYQWPQDMLKQRRTPGDSVARPCLTINKLPQHHRQVTNEQRMNRPQIRVQPVDDKGDPEVAEIYNGLVRHIQVASEADLAYDLACDAQAAGGVGYFRILTEYCDETSFDQDIRIKPIKDRFKVYFDPNIQHPAGEDAKWAFIIEDLPKEEYEALYKDDPVDWNEAGRGDQTQWFPNKETVRIAEYFSIEEEEKKLFLWQVGEDFVASVEGEPMPAGVPAGSQPVKERKTRLQKCVWRKINGQKELKKTELPTKYIPVIRVVGNEWVIEGKPIVSGLVRNAKDAQRMYNYWASQEVEMLALAPKAPFIGYAGQFEGFEDKWKRANVVPYPYLEVNPAVDETTGQVLPLPQRAMPPMPSAGIIQAKLGASDDIKSTTGQYDASLGQKSNETSGKAIMARQREGDIGTYHYVDNLARAIRHAGRIIVDMIPKVYDTKRIARIIGEDGESDHVMVDPTQPQPYKEVSDEAGKKIGKIYNLNVGKYDVVVNVGPSYTTKRQEAAEAMTQIGSAIPKIWEVAGDLIVKNMDWPGADEIAKRLKKAIGPLSQDEEEQEPMVQTPQGPIPASQAGQMLAQLMQQVEGMGQALERADVAEQEAKAAKAQVDQFRAETERLKAADQAKLTDAKIKEMIFNAVKEYVDRTPVEDSALLAPAGAEPEQIQQ